MRPTLQPAATASLRPTRPHRLLWRWWRRQSPSRQDRFATLGPLISVLLFLAAIVSAFWYLRNEETERTTESIRRGAEATHQQIRLRLLEQQETLVRLSRELSTRAIDDAEFLEQARRLIHDHPETTRILWADTRGRVLLSEDSTPLESTPSTSPRTALPRTFPVEGASASATAFRAARDSLTAAYSTPFVNEREQAVIQVLVPVMHRSLFTGVLVAEYSLIDMLRLHVPRDVEERYTLGIVGDDGQLLASTAAMPRNGERAPQLLEAEVALTPLPGTSLRSQGYRSTVSLVGNTLFWMVLALSALTVWMLVGTWRHMRRRVQAQAALISETNFRRAMENSMLTGMRAMDMEGRITYVNPAFCAMTGFNESELIGLLPPYPHWPPDRGEENMRILQLELQGRSPAGGIEVKAMRKDGSLFDARMYVSPLIDSRGQQSGWMTSMTNITEAKRIRDQLSASHERFTTVLEGLEAAVSVVSVQQGELLFANRSYRLWFGADAHGHSLLAGEADGLGKALEGGDEVDGFGGLPTQELTDAAGDMREVYLEGLDKWFDVRARYLQWTDGRLAQMLIATDVTARRRAEDTAALQAERAAVTSRLMTMGEMASSVAHELNQPLTAISNYCNGMISRVNGSGMSQTDLVGALEKTARQAQRAGQIIHRIRNFVKKSEPQRQSASAQQVVDEATELASFELKRRNVTLKVYVAQQLPLLVIDPILIEQVIVNLLKNAAEAIDNARMPPTRRFIELRVVPRHRQDEGDVVEFSVTDQGPGVPQDMIGRLYEAFLSTKPDGMGIGLSLCRSIIESHRGRIRAENLYNGAMVTGCRFTFTLPVNSVSDAAPTQSPTDTESA